MYAASSDERRRRAAQHARFELKRSRRDRVSLAYLTGLSTLAIYAAMLLN